MFIFSKAHYVLICYLIYRTYNKLKKKKFVKNPVLTFDCMCSLYLENFYFKKLLFDIFQMINIPYNCTVTQNNLIFSCDFFTSMLICITRILICNTTYDCTRK